MGTQCPTAYRKAPSSHTSASSAVHLITSSVPAQLPFANAVGHLIVAINQLFISASHNFHLYLYISITPSAAIYLLADGIVYKYFRFYLLFLPGVWPQYPQHGRFGADMKVELLNDGPFTLMLDSQQLFGE